MALLRSRPLLPQGCDDDDESSFELTVTSETKRNTDLYSSDLRKHVFELASLDLTRCTHLDSSALMAAPLPGWHLRN